MMLHQGSAASFPSLHRGYINLIFGAGRLYGCCCCKGLIPSGFGLTCAFPLQTLLAKAAGYRPALQTIWTIAHLVTLRSSPAHRNTHTGYQALGGKIEICGLF